MKKTVKVFIDENEISLTIRRLKLKEAKRLIVDLASKVDTSLSEFDGLNKQEIYKEFPKFLSTHIDYFVDTLIEPYTSLTHEQIDEVDITDIFTLLKELMEFNGIKMEQIINFFMSKGVKEKMEQEVKAFQGTIPTAP